MKWLCLFLLFIALTVSAQVVPGTAIANVDDFHDNPNNGKPNCTGDHPGAVNPPEWEWNCDAGTPNCGGGNGQICGNSKFVSTPSRDGQSRELDATWTCAGGICNPDAYGGVIAHVAANTGNNTGDQSFSWGGWFYYTDMSKVNRVEIDLNQVMSASDVMIYAAQCNFDINKWQFANHWLLDSDVSCSAGQFTTNTWHHILISAHRCANYVPNNPCNITYESVSFDGVEVDCTVNCVHDGNNNLVWGPIGLLLENVQLDFHFTTPGGTIWYADQMSINSPSTQQDPPAPTALTVTSVG